MKSKCFTEAGTALTKIQTESVLALGYDHFMCKGNTTYLSGLMGAQLSNSPSSVHPQLTSALGHYELFQ